jgi:hypothetical protein
MVVTLWAHSEYIAVAEMGFLSRGAYRKGVLALVAQRDLWLTLAACGLFFVSALFGLAAWGMRAMEFADAGGLTDAPAVVPRSSGFESVDIVRPAELLDRPDHGGPLSLTYGRFGDILVELFLDVFRPGRCAA